MWNCRKSPISAIFEKVDFWRFWVSGTTRNNGDLQFLVAKSCLAQDFRPGCQVWAQSLNCIPIVETPQKCDFRGSRHVCVKNGQNSGGRARPHEWLKSTQIIMLWLKTVKNLFGILFGIFWWVFRAEKNIDFVPFLKVPVQDLGSGSRFSSSTVCHQKCLKLPQTTTKTPSDWFFL